MFFSIFLTVSIILLFVFELRLAVDEFNHYDAVIFKDHYGEELFDKEGTISVVGRKFYLESVKDAKQSYDLLNPDKFQRRAILITIPFVICLISRLLINGVTVI